ncbi:peptide chain release factor 2 [Helicobacter cappadocius]|uniref:Peptide chain release factor 2 n=1 Tax=Helicobacter cappadocius TaxID=3063998 RepID=A0AA90Q1K4_9HELI|nr:MULTISPECIES: peptide chain release factor 2 [unclassified Helicobacter]MDO7252631.1 peptide chain release factor 2 [Helicobacter sp. faydin-H75]MDP2538498.1 peptide chain release factor 2 [Helicobacter sp. faydin-H76]
MDSYEYGELLKELKNKCENIAKIIKPESLQKRLEEIVQMQQDQDFWNDSKKAGEISKEKVKIERILKTYDNAKKSIDDSSELFSLVSSDNDPSTLELLFEEAPELDSRIKKVEIEVMLSGENDNTNAIVTIQPGAGGTESQDWGSILYRMYLRWAERRGFKTEILDYQDGEEAGIKGVAFLIKGENAYGYMKSENGVHRLVRISPFDANAKRHTSFASVQVSPEVDDDIDIVIEEKDIRIDTYRASGAGGQHVNKTESAIRITHLPSGIVVQCQNDRSQHKNKATALKMLKSKLYELELEKQNSSNTTGEEKSEIGWGHQIRSYVLAPYQQVKDARSNIAYSNVEAILDGDIDDIIEGVLISKA